MKPFSVVVSSVAVVVGVGGGALAYQTVSASVPDAAAVDQPSTRTVPVAVVERPKVKHRMAPCKPPTVQKGKVCVLDVVKTVVIPASNGSTPSTSPSPNDQPDSDESEDRSNGSHDESDDEGTHEPSATHQEDADDHEEEDGNEPGDHEDEDDE